MYPNRFPTLHIGIMRQTNLNLHFLMVFQRVLTFLSQWCLRRIFLNCQQLLNIYPKRRFLPFFIYWFIYFSQFLILTIQWCFGIILLEAWRAVRKKKNDKMWKVYENNNDNEHILNKKAHLSGFTNQVLLSCRCLFLNKRKHRLLVFLWRTQHH